MTWASAAHGSASGPLEARLADLREVNRFIPQRALPMLRSIEGEARAAEPAVRAEFLAQLCTAYYSLGKQEQALAACDELIELGRASGDNDALAKGLLNKGYVEFALNDVPLAHKLVWESEQLAGRTADTELRLRTIISSGQSYAEEGSFELALQRLQSAASLARGHGDPVEIVIAQNALAQFYGALHEYGKGFQALAAAMPAAQQSHSPGRVATLRTTEAKLALDSGQYQHALGALLAGLALERQIGADSMAVGSMLSLSDCYLRLNKYGNAASYASQALAAARALNNESLIAKARAALTQAHPEVFKRQREKEILELQERYEADKKQRLLELLRRENDVKSAELVNRRLQQRVWAGAMMAFALAAIIVAVLYRKVRHANAALLEKNLELKQQSVRDPLTGLYNRRYFQEFMRDRAELVERGCDASDEGITGALFVLDVDHFKHINDAHGHAAGDTVLNAIATRLRETLRGTDMIVRWGGEEFLMFLPALRRDGLDELARRLLTDIQSTEIEVQGMKLMVGASIGFAPFPLMTSEQPESWERALHLVDMALYLAKRHGRNRAIGVRSCVRMMQEQIERDLEGAWKAGYVELSIVLPGQILEAAA